jgi:hypothetical protein
MENVDLVLAQAPTGVSRETAAEALVVSCGDVADTIKLLWEAETKPQAPPEFALDSSQRKWASVSEVAESIFNSTL